jgi:hypothetical protein
MAQQFPCPNPACSHTFAAADFQAGSEVVCPRCGFKLKGRGGPTPPAARPPSRSAPGAVPPKKPPTSAKPARPTPPAAGKIPIAQAIPVPRSPRPAPPPAPVKIAVAQPIATQPRPVAPAAHGDFDVELVEPPAAASAGNDAADTEAGLLAAAPGDGPLIRARGGRGGFQTGRLLLGGGALVTALCLLLVGSLAVIYLMGGDTAGLRIFAPRGGTVASIHTKNGNEKIFQLALPDKTWSMDKDVRSGMRARSGGPDTWFAEAWKHNEEDVWFAIVAKDYGQQKPRDAEMVRVAVDKLEQVFGEAVEAASKPEAATFGALPAQRLPFKGQLKSAFWRGDCYMFFKSGFAYWFFVSSPDAQAAREWADKLQREDVFSTQIVERRGWREQPPPTETFAGLTGTFTMTGPEGLWEKQAKGDEPRDLLGLLGRYRKEKDNRKNAGVLVYTLDHKADLKEAMKAARADVEAKKKEDNSNYKLVSAGEVAEEVKGQSEFGEALDIGSRPGRIADLCLMIGADPKRYILLGVANEPDACYVFRCDCTWESRQIWRQDFLELLRTFQLKK